MTKQIVLITGCSKGGIGKKFYNSRNSKNRAYLSFFKQGYALSKKFAQEGNHVIATTRNIDALEGLEGTFLIFKEPSQLANKNIEFGCEKEALDINDQKSIDTVVQVCK